MTEYASVRDLEEARSNGRPNPPPNGRDPGERHRSPPPGGQPSDPPLALSTVTLADFLQEKLPPREQVLSPILPVRGLAMLFAGRGVGKTHVGMGIAYAVACGGEFLRWRAPKPRRVLYVDGEMSQELLQERGLAMQAAASYRPYSDEHFVLLSMDRQPLGTSVNLARPEHQAALEAKLEGIELLVLDNLSTLVNGGRENDAESWNEMQAWLLQLRRRGVTVLLVHHSGRGDNARGTSKREDVLDTIIHLKHPDDYEVEEGARFEVHLTKARGIHGDAALPFEARLNVFDGMDHWACTVLRDKVLDQIEEMTRDKNTVRDIADELGISKSKVNRLQAKLRADGRL